MNSLFGILLFASVASLPPADASPRADTGRPVQRFTQDIGHRASRGGPVETLRDGTLLWINTEPEAPYMARAMWPISRIAMRRSTDGGNSWSDPEILQQGTREYSLLSHCLKRLANGSLVHIFVRYGGYDYETGGRPEKSLCEAFVQHSADEGRTWSEPARLPTGERYIGDVLSIEELRDGRLVYPFAYLTPIKAQFACSALYSDDHGRTWKRSGSKLEAGGAGFESGASEPTVVELADGMLWMLIRAQTGFLWESHSKDRGQTWSVAKPSRLPSSNAPATALRLRSGEIAVAWNNHVESNYARQSLVVGLTRDGRTFHAVREIDFTDFPDNEQEPALHVTYPYLTEARDGRVAVSYNKGRWMRHNRPTLALVDPSWLRARSEAVDFRDGRVGWHTANPGPNRTAALENYVVAPGSDMLALQIEPARDYAKPAGIVRNIPLVSKGEITLSVRVTRPEAWLLLGDSRLDPTNVGEACVRIRLADGRAWVAAGTPTRKQSNRRTTEFHYLSYAIQDESPYPSPVPAGEKLTVAVRYDASRKAAAVRINDGPAVEVSTGEILGLAYVGFSVGKDGALQIESVHTALND